MAIDFDEQWKKVRTVAIADEAKSIRTLVKILASKEGRTFILDLEPSEAALCIEILDRVSSNPPISHPSQSLTNVTIQGLAEHKLRSSQKQAFFGTLRRLAGKHARLPDSMVITDKIDYSARQPHTSGGFADIKPGQYKGCTVAVKVLRVAATDDFEKIRKVSGKGVFPLGQECY